MLTEVIANLINIVGTVKDRVAATEGLLATQTETLKSQTTTLQAMEQCWTLQLSACQEMGRLIKYLEELVGEHKNHIFLQGEMIKRLVNYNDKKEENWMNSSSYEEVKEWLREEGMPRPRVDEALEKLKNIYLEQQKEQEEETKVD